MTLFRLWINEWRNPICLIRGWWNTIWYRAPMSGHSYVEVDDVTLRCETCGHESKAFKPWDIQ